MRSTRLLRFPCLLLVAALVSPAVAHAQGARAGVVTAVLGTVTVARATTPEPAPLRFKDDVFPNDRVATGEESVARILLGGKAIVTVRERSQLVVKELPNVTQIDMGVGRILMAVDKQRMKPGESVEIRTPNAVAGIRGTVFIVDVRSEDGRLSTSFTVLRGAIEVTPLDGATRRPAGAPVSVSTLQTVSVMPGTTPAARGITPEAASAMAGEFKVPLKGAPAVVQAAVSQGQVNQAAGYAQTILGDRRSDSDRRDRSGDQGQRDRGPRADQDKGQVGGSGGSSPAASGAPSPLAGSVSTPSISGRGGVAPAVNGPVVTMPAASNLGGLGPVEASGDLVRDRDVKVRRGKDR